MLMGSPRRSGTGSVPDDRPQALPLICATDAGFDRLSQPSNHQVCRFSRLMCKPRRCSAWSHRAYRSILMCESFSRRKRSLIFSLSSFHCLTCIDRSNDATETILDTRRFLNFSAHVRNDCFIMHAACNASVATAQTPHIPSSHLLCC